MCTGPACTNRSNKDALALRGPLQNKKKKREERVGRVKEFAVMKHVISSILKYTLSSIWICTIICIHTYVYCVWNFYLHGWKSLKKLCLFEVSLLWNFFKKTRSSLECLSRIKSAWHWSLDVLLLQQLNFLPIGLAREQTILLLVL